MPEGKHRQATAAEGDDAQAESGPRIFRHVGKHYVAFLSFVMETLGTRSYFEIGTRKGGSLAGLNCNTVAVDPNFIINSNVIGGKSVCMFFQMGSDRFFEDYKLSQLLNGPVEVAFLDGFHVYEYLLRDFINTEKHCKKNSVIFMHDCLPFTQPMAERETPRNREARTQTKIARDFGGWTGDVWKVVPILRKYRPDLKIYALDCPPTGLIMITGLDPSNTVLDGKLFDIIDEFRESPADPQNLLEFGKTTELIATKEILDLSDLGKYVW